MLLSRTATKIAVEPAPGPPPYLLNFCKQLNSGEEHMILSRRHLATWAVTLLLLVNPGLAQRPARQKTLTGVISDAMCGARHRMQGSAADCTRACLQKGSRFALVVGDNIYLLNGHEAELNKLAGQRVTITGVLDGSNFEVSSVQALP
jgi:hypothetical protein